MVEQINEKNGQRKMFNVRNAFVYLESYSKYGHNVFFSCIIIIILLIDFFLVMPKYKYFTPSLSRYRT